MAVVSASRRWAAVAATPLRRVQLRPREVAHRLRSEARRQGVPAADRGVDERSTVCSCGAESVGESADDDIVAICSPVEQIKANRPPRQASHLDSPKSVRAGCQSGG